MTDTTPTTPPATAPAKKSPWRIIGPIIAVLVVLGGIVYQVVLPAMADAKYKEGACLDFIPTSEVSTNLDERPGVVDCDDTQAQSKIVAVFDNKTIDDAETTCPGWGTQTIAVIEVPAGSFLSKDKLLCLDEA